MLSFFHTKLRRTCSVYMLQLSITLHAILTHRYLMRSYMNRYVFTEVVHTDIMSAWLPRLASLLIDHPLIMGGVFPTVRRTNRAFGMSRLTNLEVNLRHSGSIILGPDIGHFTRLSRFVVFDSIDLEDTTRWQHVWGNLTRLTKLTELELHLKSNADPLEVYELPSDLGKLTALTSLYIAWPDSHALALPSSIGLLTRLKALKIIGGQQLKFRDEDDAVFNLKLENLYLQIRAVLPSAIGRLSTLKSLALRTNATVLPDQIGMLSNLTHLDVRGNHLRYVVCVCVCVCGALVAVVVVHVEVYISYCIALFMLSRLPLFASGLVCLHTLRSGCVLPLTVSKYLLVPFFFENQDPS